MIKTVLKFTGRFILNTLIAGLVVAIVFAIVTILFGCIMWLLMQAGLSNNIAAWPALIICIALGFGLKLTVGR